METLTDAVNAIDLPALVSTLYPDSGARPGRAGAIKAVWRGDENPSASLFRHGEAWLLKDHGTGETWNALQFLTDIERMEHSEALERLGIQTVDPEPTPRRVSPPAPRREALEGFKLAGEPGWWVPPVALAGRGFTKKHMERYGIYNDNGDAIIPITGPDGKVYNVKRKLANPEGKKRYRYEESGHGDPCWFSPGFLDSNSQVWVEGELNAMALDGLLWQDVASIGVVGIPGAGAPLPDIDLTHKTVYLYADGDKPGEALRERFPKWAIDHGAQKVILMEPLENEDFCDVMGRPDGHVVLREYLQEQRENKPVMTILDREVHDDYTLGELRVIGQKYITGQLIRPMGYSELDAYTGGLPLTGIISIAALPSMGKSVMVRDVCTYQAMRNSEKVLHFTPDQSIPEVAMFLANKLSGISASLLRSNNYPPKMLDEYGSPEAIRKAWGEVYDHCLLKLSKQYRLSEAGHVKHIRKRIEKALNDGFTFFAFDYGQILKHYDDRGREVEDRAIDELKLMTRDYKVPFLVALQLSKSKFDYGKKRSPLPFVTDIQGRGAYQQASEQIYMIWDYEMFASEYATEETPWPPGVEHDIGKVRVYVRKNKGGPQPQGIYRYLRKRLDLGTFVDMTEGVSR